MARAIATKIITAVMLQVSAFIAPAHSEETLTWDTTVELRGSVRQEAHYGPPNYGETPLDDRVEVALVLLLDQAITVGGESEFTDGPVERQSEIQLVLHTEAMFRDLPSAPCVQVEGKLFGSHTGHHHRPVLMFVDSYRLCDQAASAESRLEAAKGELPGTQRAAVPYDPSIAGLPWNTATALQGFVQLETFDGPPGYGETPLDDLMETIRVLVLDQAVTVNGPSDRSWPAALDQLKIHLDSMDTNLRTEIPLQSCLLVTGSLSGNNAEHVYYPVLMIVESYRPCP